LVAKKALMDRKCSFYRGVIIHHMVQVETRVEMIIGYFLSNNTSRSAEIFAVLNTQDGITFSTKCNIIGLIAKNYHPEFLTDYPNFQSEIDRLIKLRNTAAHKKFAPSDEKIESFDGDKIELMWMTTKRGEPKTETLLLSKEITTKIITDVYNLIDMLLNLEKRVRSNNTA
jgi:hypothetical protein